MKEKLKTIPVPILATMVGACTLSNVYNGAFNYVWLRHIIFVIMILVMLLYIGKIVTNPDVFREEYSKTPMSALYAGFTMCLMLFSSYIFEWAPGVAKAVWFFAIIVHAIHICIFTYRNVIKGVKLETFVPSWFVTYNGIMVSVVIGGVMKEPVISKIITYYGIAVFTVIIPFMIWRLATKPIADALYHTQPVVLAPCSLCLVCYFNVMEQTGADPNKIIVYYLYAAVILALIFILYKLPSFFRYDFTPGFAGMTFPMAIGCVATTRFMGYMNSIGMENVGAILKEVQGIQVFLTTGIIFFVLIKYFILLKKNFIEA